MLSKSNSPIITLPSEILLFILTHLTVKQLLPLQNPILPTCRSLDRHPEHTSTPFLHSISVPATTATLEYRDGVSEYGGGDGSDATGGSVL
ncbi:hypothetical protein BGZ47_010527 [Haplosporangium gracile]|nr:hypothetical protein BGZ47_010527 [Haplosporangium gracile]